MSETNSKPANLPEKIVVTLRAGGVFFAIAMVALYALDVAAPRIRTSSCRHARVSPAAIRICSLTKSKPVTNSVTGCSTCKRVFISRK